MGFGIDLQIVLGLRFEETFYKLRAQLAPNESLNRVGKERLRRIEEWLGTTMEAHA